MFPTISTNHLGADDDNGGGFRAFSGNSPEERIFLGLLEEAVFLDFIIWIILISSKNMMKAKDPQFAKIDVVIKGFIKCPPSVGTLLVNLAAQQVA
ncbi:hypothetical protein CFP56_043292 [Quercus suber]|uniref:Uncharacterized protein n=1 Tax=Quercus suber TaxID=58331 RepID=A0AAW0LH95_QUESU